MGGNYLKLDYDYLPVKGHIYKMDTLVQKWSIDNPEKLIHDVIDDMDISVFGKINIKKTLKHVTDVFPIKSIKIIEKE